MRVVNKKSRGTTRNEWKELAQKEGKGNTKGELVPEENSWTGAKGPI
jgi:hypothetical protein